MDQVHVKLNCHLPASLKLSLAVSTVVFFQTYCAMPCLQRKWHLLMHARFYSVFKYKYRLEGGHSNICNICSFPAHLANKCDVIQVQRKPQTCTQALHVYPKGCSPFLVLLDSTRALRESSVRRLWSVKWVLSKNLHGWVSLPLSLTLSSKFKLSYELS